MSPNPSYYDPASVAGQALPIDERTDLLVIGAGAAGLACAMAAVAQGRQVILVDENPVPATTMGDDIPLLWGGAATGAVRNRTAMMEAFIASDPAIEAAFDAGVDLRLGTACFGLFAPGPNATWLPGPVAALMDEARSWMVAADQVVVATGRRDMGLAFAGWELPGVVGATAAHRLLTRYGALAARRAVILGSTNEALQTALALHAAGIAVAAIVEQAPALMAAPSLVAAIEAARIPVLCGHVLRRAEGTDHVQAALVTPIDGGGTPHGIPCDTIILGVGVVPVIELLDAAGCRTRFDAARGGIVPVLDAQGQTTIPGLFATGDCAGLETDLPIDAYRRAWVQASVIEGDPGVHVCRCEEVTAREILEVRPPRYLGAAPDGRNDRSLRSLLGQGAPNPDLVKRLTRAGMGLCQGRRCREQVAALLALGAGLDLAAIPPATHRAPVRPIPLALAAAATEPAGMAEHWDTWFGMPAQYRPLWNVIMPYTAAARDLNEPSTSE